MSALETEFHIFYTSSFAKDLRNILSMHVVDMSNKQNLLSMWDYIRLSKGTKYFFHELNLCIKLWLIRNMLLFSNTRLSPYTATIEFSIMLKCWNR